MAFCCSRKIAWIKAKSIGSHSGSEGKTGVYKPWKLRLIVNKSHKCRTKRSIDLVAVLSDHSRIFRINIPVIGRSAWSSDRHIVRSAQRTQFDLNSPRCSWWGAGRICPHCTGVDKVVERLLQIRELTIIVSRFACGIGRNGKSRYQRWDHKKNKNERYFSQFHFFISFFIYFRT